MYSIAFAPDGRTLAAAGATVRREGCGAARPGAAVRPGSRADRPPRGADVRSRLCSVRRPNERVTMCSDVAFTPDGRRVVAVAMQKIRIWDVATGAEQDAFERDTAGGIRPPRRLARRPMAGGHLTVRGRRQHPRHHPAGTVTCTGSDATRTLHVLLHSVSNSLLKSKAAEPPASGKMQVPAVPNKQSGRSKWRWCRYRRSLM